MSMNQDPFSGTGKNFSGQVEEGFGRVTGDVKTEVEGKMKQAAGAAQDLYGQVNDVAGDAARSVQEQAAPLEELLRNTIETGRTPQWPWGSGLAVHRPHGWPCGLLTPLDPRRSSETVGGSADAVPDCLHLFTSNLRSGVGPSGAVAASKAPIFGDGRSTSAGADDPGPAATRRRCMAIGLRIAPRGDCAVCASTDSQRARSMRGR